MWSTFKAIFWAFLGIRSAKGYDADREKLKIYQVMIAGVVCALIFVGMLLVLVKFITAK